MGKKVSSFVKQILITRILILHHNIQPVLQFRINYDVSSEPINQNKKGTALVYNLPGDDIIPKPHKQNLYPQKSYEKPQRFHEKYFDGELFLVTFCLFDVVLPKEPKNIRIP